MEIERGMKGKSMSNVEQGAGKGKFEKNVEVHGEPKAFGASYKDDGKHSGHTLKACPFCGGDDLAVCNTHTATYWVQCNACHAQKDGEDIESADDAQTKAELVVAHYEAFLSAVLGWNKRA